MTGQDHDVVDLLLDQHTEIRQLFEEVEQAPQGDARQESFDRFRRLLAMHETAEEELVHPLARRTLPDGGTVVDERLGGEHQAKEILQQLDGLGPGDPQFDGLLTRLREAVLTHAEAEEPHEFVQLRQHSNPDELQAFAAAVRLAEPTTPTRPRPGMESATANLVAGPFAAVVDRVRDVLRGATGGSGSSS